jgi:mono/diheme cytochrome c family protein
MKAVTHIKLILFLLLLPVLGIAALLQAQAPPTPTVVTSPPAAAIDPGVRGGEAGGGGPIAGLTARELVFFADGEADFAEVEGVGDGLGPRMNLDSCAGCHAQPATGGTSPSANPQVAFASKDGGTDTVPHSSSR